MLSPLKNSAQHPAPEILIPSQPKRCLHAVLDDDAVEGKGREAVLEERKNSRGYFRTIRLSMSSWGAFESQQQPVGVFN